MAGLNVGVAFESVKSAQHVTDCKFPFYKLTVNSSGGFTFDFPMTEQAFRQYESMTQEERDQLRQFYGEYTEYDRKKKIKVTRF